MSGCGCDDTLTDKEFKDLMAEGTKLELADELVSANLLYQELYPRTCTNAKRRVVKMAIKLCVTKMKRRTVVRPYKAGK